MNRKYQRVPRVSENLKETFKNPKKFLMNQRIEMNSLT